MRTACLTCLNSPADNCVNYKNSDQCIGRSFYFGSNNSQIYAFKSAIEYMIDSDIYNNTIKDTLDTHKSNIHTNLL